MRCFMSVSSFNSKYDKVMFAYSYSEDSHERASVNNMLECIVQSSADDEMTWQRVRRCVVVVTFRDSTLNTANLWPAMSAVDLPYLFTVTISLAVWSIFSCL